MNQAVPLFDIPEADRQILQSWVRGGNTRQKLARRVRIVLLAQSGLGPMETRSSPTWPNATPIPSAASGKPRAGRS